MSVRWKKTGVTARKRLVVKRAVEAHHSRRPAHRLQNPSFVSQIQRHSKAFHGQRELDAAGCGLQCPEAEAVI